MSLTADYNLSDSYLYLMKCCSLYVQPMQHNSLYDFDLMTLCFQAHINGARSRLKLKLDRHVHTERTFKLKSGCLRHIWLLDTMCGDISALFSDWRCECLPLMATGRRNNTPQTDEVHIQVNDVSLRYQLSLLKKQNHENCLNSCWDLQWYWLLESSIWDTDETYANSHPICGFYFLEIFTFVLVLSCYQTGEAQLTAV